MPDADGGTTTGPIDGDTDNDDLKDGEEDANQNGATVYEIGGTGTQGSGETDPNNADTDDDGLSDGQEVNTTKSDPLDTDTDDGSIDDGTEVNVNGTDPLNAADDAAGPAGGSYLSGGCEGGQSTTPWALLMAFMALALMTVRKRSNAMAAAVSAAGVAAVALAVVAGGSAPAHAEAKVQADNFEPHYGQGTAILNSPKTDLIPHLRPTFGAMFHISNGLVVLNEVDGAGNETQKTLLGNSYKLEVYGGLGLFDWIDLGITLPLVLDQDIADNAALDIGGGSVSLQDIRFSVRGRFLKPEDFSGVGLGMSLGLWFPTGSDTQFTTDGYVRFEPKILFDWRHESGFLIGLNAGLHLRPTQTHLNVVTDTSFRWSISTEIPLGVDDLHLLGTAFGSVALADNLDPTDPTQTVNDIYSKPIELLGAVRYWWREHNIVFQAGAGAGVTRGLGAPAWRVLLSVDYTPAANDADGDGIPDERDKCPDVREDRDSFQDEDGCPDPDNDKDGILDVDDKCPDNPEDKDSFEDADGCPDPDNDKDGILDEADKCPQKPEDKDGFEDTDGCPDPDNDKDGVLDGADKCPLEPEDRDGFEDTDGCPDVDNDKDGVLDVDDVCPMKPETKNGFNDDDGCPDKKDPNAKVQVTKRYITIKGKVNFATGKAKLRGKSTFSLLNEVAQVLNDYKQITKLRIEGHTDNRGSDGYNKRLSQKRAESVRKYLIARGIAASRLVPMGFGEERPKVPNKGKKNLALNRRTEFFILEINGRAVSKDAKVTQ